MTSPIILKFIKFNKNECSLFIIVKNFFMNFPFNIWFEFSYNYSPTSGFVNVCLLTINIMHYFELILCHITINLSYLCLNDNGAELLAFEKRIKPPYLTLSGNRKFCHTKKASKESQWMARRLRENEWEPVMRQWRI